MHAPRFITSAVSQHRARSGPIGDSGLFWSVVAIHLLLWTLLPILVHPNAPLDVIEGAVWGREWQLGYPKGPPLFAWVMGAIDAAPPGPRLAITFLISQLCICITFFGVWRLGMRLLSRREALISVLLMEGIYFIGVPTPELNEIVLQMPIAAILGWIFHRAISDGKLRDWLLVAVLGALGMWTRYSVAVMLLSLFLFLMLSPARRCLRSAGPYAALVLFLALCAPHLWWVVVTDAQSFDYVGARAPRLVSVLDYIREPLRFTGAQLLALLPALLLALILITRPSWRSAQENARPLSTESRLYLLAVALGPFVLAQLLAVSMGLGLRSMWGAPLWCFFGLFLTVTLRAYAVPQFGVSFSRAWLAALVLPLLFYGLSHILRPTLWEEKRASFPGQLLAQAITDSWHAATAERLSYVVGDLWLAGNLAFYSDDRPSAFVGADAKQAPWIELANLHRKGGVLVWDGGRDGDTVPAWLAASFPDAIGQPVLMLPRLCLGCRKEVAVGWALLPPRAGDNEPAGDQRVTYRASLPAELSARRGVD